MRLLALFSVFFLTTFEIFSQVVWMHPNQGQWDNRISYKIDLDLGEMYLEKTGFTYFLHTAKSRHMHNAETEHAENAALDFQAHVIRTEFIGANTNAVIRENNTSDFYRNYFIGNDSSKWKAHVKSFSLLEYVDYYPGTNLILDGSNQKLKYSFFLKPGSDASKIKYTITGANKSYIDQNGKLHHENRFGEITESAPIAWTEKEGKKTKVEVEYRLLEGVVSFQFPNGYDSTASLIIDPYLVFSTFTGSTADNWGFTAAPDADGNVFAGGIVFSGGYPTTNGAFDGAYNIGTESGYNVDVGITKFNSTGTALLYSTYLGGNGNETPNSIICAPSGDLYVFGVTSSVNFPMGPSPYDNSFNGGPTVVENNIGFSGSDIYIARLNPNGTALLSSTFVGGGGTDGLNSSSLHYNYGDQFRGEISLDSIGNIYVASTTQSANFPVLLGSQNALSGTQDAVVFKMNANLSSMLWSTYFGGNTNETGNSIQVASNGSVYVAGGTSSINLPFLTGNDLTFNGGISDGYLTRFNGTNGALIAGTYMGFTEYDQAYFVQLDLDNNAYVFGQSQSSWPISVGCYGNPNSGQFIRKYSPNLLTINWSTMIGGGTGNVEISPTAFLVSDCYDIYLSGWGGSVNQSGQAAQSTSNGFPTTFDAFQTTTNGSNFYIAVLDQDAAMLKYATYMGGSTSSYNHVDGGTSRFDKSGRIYHAVCGACGGSDYGFTSTPGVWSPTNNSTNCNLAAFKFELNSIEAIVSEPQTIVCMPAPVIFDNNSSNGNTFLWNFGDGTFSTAINPSHFYSAPGDYNVTLVVADSNGCFSPDSVNFVVNIGDFQGGVTLPTNSICPGETAQLEAFGGANYSWSPANLLDDPTSPTPIATVLETTLFTVIISDSCGTDTLSLTLVVFQSNSSISNDTSICVGNSVQLQASGGGTYLWSPPTFLDNVSISNPISTPANTITYFVEVISVNGCVANDTVTISVFFDPPVPQVPVNPNMCVGDSLTLTVSGAETYVWSPNYQINTLVGSSVTVSPADDFTYYCDFTNACGTLRDSVMVLVVSATILAGNDTIVCPGESVPLWASGGVSYSWFPNQTLNNAYAAQVIATPAAPTIYSVIGTDQNGCVDTANVFVDLFPLPFIQTSPDVYALFGDVIQLSATSSTPGPYTWSPAEYVSCVNCSSPTVQPDVNMDFTVTYTDINGCAASDIVSIYYTPILFIPNTFTPNGDESNQGFRISASNIRSFELLLFDRWGELIYTMDDLKDYWDGSYNGYSCQDGTYVWTIKYYDFLGKAYALNGHVNLIR